MSRNSGIGGGAPPSAALLTLDGGFTIGKRGLDRWSMVAKPPRTTLNGAITNVATALAVRPLVFGTTSVPTFTNADSLIQIDNERMLVTAGQGTLNWTVIRGVDGTAAAAHADKAPVLGSGVSNIVLIGDSTAQATVGGADEFAARLGRSLGRAFAGGVGLLGRGFWPIWRSGDVILNNNTPNSGTEWSILGGAWTQVNPLTSQDRAPFGCAVSSSGGVGAIIQFALPPNVVVAQVDIIYEEIALNVWSYSLDNGATWINAPGAGTVVQANNSPTRVPIVTTLPVGTLQIRAASAAGVAATVRGVMGIDLWSTVPTFGTTVGLKIHNLGKDAETLADFARTGNLGDDFAILDGYSGSIVPDLLICGPFTNDLAVQPDPTVKFIPGLQAIAARVLPYADILFLNYAEQSGRDVATQALFRQTVKNIAAANNCAVLDLYDSFAAEGDVGFAACNADGLMNDALHCSQLGNNEIGARIMRALSLSAI